MSVISFSFEHLCRFRIQPKKLAHYASQRAEFMVCQNTFTNYSYMYFACTEELFLFRLFIIYIMI